MSDDPEIFADNAEDGAMKALEEMEMRLKQVSADLAAVTEERDRLREAIKFIAGQPLSSQLDAEEQDGADYEGAYDGFIRDARAELEGVTEPASLWQHKKTGGIYEIVGECQIESTNTPGVLYRNRSTGVTWVRPKEEFFDGRFEKVTPIPPR